MAARERRNSKILKKVLCFLLLVLGLMTVELATDFTSSFPQTQVGGNQTSYKHDPKDHGPAVSVRFAGVNGLLDFAWLSIKSHPDAFVAAFTGLLALVTGWLVIVTRGLLREARNQFPHFKANVEAAASAAKAAQDSADAAKTGFLSTHRPKIRLKHLWLQSDIWREEPIRLRVVIVNGGVTDATIVEVNVAVFVVDASKDLPPEPPFKATTIFRPSATTLPSGITYEFMNVTDGKVLNTSEWIMLRNGSSRLYCCGYVDYLDAASKLRKTAFCRVLRRNHNIRDDPGRFVGLDPVDTDYEYED